MPRLSPRPLALLCLAALLSVARAGDRPAPRTDAHGDPLPDGARLRLGTLRLRHGPGAVTLAVAHDGKRLATTSAGAADVRLWDPATGKELFRLEGHRSPNIPGLAFSPDGTTLASCGHDGTVRVWDLAARKQRFAVEHNAGMALAVVFAPDGKTFATGTADRVIRICSAADGKVVRTLDTERHGCACLAYAPDGKTLASSGFDRVVRLWDLTQSNAYRTLVGHTTGVGSIAFAPDGKLLASGAWDGTVRLWDARDARELHTLAGAARPLGARVAFSPDGKLLAASLDDGELRLWDAATAKPVRSIRAAGHRFSGVAFVPGRAALLAAPSHSAVALFDPATGRELRPDMGHVAAIHGLAFSPDNKSLAAASADRTVTFWDTATARLLRRLDGPADAARCVAFAPDGKSLACGWGTVGGSVYIWDLKSDKHRLLAEGDWPYLQSLAFAPDGRSLTLASNAAAAPLLDAASGKLLRSFEGHDGPVVAAAVSHDGKLIATAAPHPGDRTIRLWDASSGKQVARWVGAGAFGRLEFVPGGGALVSVGEGGAIRVWEVPGGRLLLHVSGPPHLWASAVSPDGRHVAAADDRLIRVWELATAAQWAEFRPNDLRTYALAFAHDGKTLASGGTATAATLWELMPKPDRAADVDAAWADLGNADAKAGRRAVRSLAAQPEKALALFRQRFKPAPPPPTAEELRRLVRELDSTEFRTRERATLALKQHGRLAEAELRRALAAPKSDELRRRAQALLDGLSKNTYLLSGEALRAVRVVEVLERIGTAEARALLAEVARGTPSRREVRDAAAALERLKRR